MIATLEKTAGAQWTGDAAVVASLEGVTRNYGEVRALKGVNFGVRAGEVVALLGPNGAGKTTAVKLLLGLLQPGRQLGPEQGQFLRLNLLDFFKFCPVLLQSLWRG